MINPEYFNWGQRINEGIQQSQDTRRKNALLDLEQRQYGLQERRYGLEEQRLNRADQERAAQLQAAQRKESIGLRALSAAKGDKQSGMAILQELGLPVELADDPDAAELYQSLAEQYGGFQLQQEMKLPSSFQEFALGQQNPAYASYLAQQRAQQGPTGSWSPPFQAAGPDGKPMLFRQHSVTGEIQPVQAGGSQLAPPPKGDPAAQATGASNKLDFATNTLSAIDEVEKQISGFTTGIGGKLIRATGIGGTGAYDIAANIDTIKANVGFDRLQMMREASKTGGALGQIAVQELVLLQATIASLDPNQSPDQLKKNLSKVRAQYEKSVEAYKKMLGVESGQSKDEFEVGKEYEDASGNKAIYRGNGKWEPR